MRVDCPHGVLELWAEGGGLTVLEERDGETRLRADGSGTITLCWRGRPDERLVGLGEQFGALDQRGRRWRGRIRDILAADPRDTYFAFPFVLSSTGYGLLLDTQAAPVWDLLGDPSGEGHWRVEVTAASLEVRVYRGTPKAILSAMTAFTGRAPVPEPWMLGVWKTLVSGEEAALRQAERLVREDIPVSACWVYDHYDEATNSGCGLAGTYPQGRYPDPRRLTGGLHDLGFAALGYVQPCLYAGSAPFAEAAARGHLVRGDDGRPAVIPYFNPKLHPDEMALFDDGGAYVDLTIPEARAWYQGLLAEVLDQGFDGWMQDMGEHVPDEVTLADGTPGLSNRYPLLYHEAGHEVWSARPGTGVFARSGTLGTVRYLPAMWPGDQHCDWSADRGLPSVVPAGLSIGLTGVGAWGPDIAGIVDGEPGGGLDEELWLRWCQYGALTPIMRDHLGFKPIAGQPVDLWSTPRTVATFREYAKLHQRLEPYLQACAEETAATGWPILRALLVDYPEHPEAWSIQDQYLLGDQLLVAPVLQRGARARRVWFPPGEWIGWWDGDRREGPAWADVPAPLDRIPVYHRPSFPLP